MGGNLFIGKLFGIKVSLHWTFLLLLFYIFISTSVAGGEFKDALWQAGIVIAGFACITMHEFGHALAARRYGISTQSIVLLPIGGIANLERIPENPKQELVVSIAGPLVNVAIAILLSIVIYSLGAIEGLFDRVLNFSGVGIQNFLSLLFSWNVVMVAFNLVPAFPMDGGRIFRALLSMKLGRLKATRIASWVGQGLAVITVVGSLYYQEFMLAFIAVFVFLGAQGEYQQVHSQSLLSGYKVRDILMKGYTTFHPFQRLSDAVNQLLSTQEKNFLVLNQNQIEGVLSSKDIIAGLAKHGPDEMIGKVANKNIPTLDIEDPLEKALELFQKTRIPLVPVLESGQLAGVLDMENVQEFLMIRSTQNRG